MEELYDPVILAVRTRAVAPDDVIVPGSLEKKTRRKFAYTTEAKNREFTVHHIFGTDATQYEVYQGCVSPVLYHAINGYTAMVVCYGQSGTGKTHTIMGNYSTIPGDFREGPIGALPRTAMQLFKTIDKKGLGYTVFVNFLEIHDEKERNILANVDLSPHELISLAETTEKKVNNIYEFFKLLHYAENEQARAARRRKSSEVTSVYTIIIKEKSAVGGKDEYNVVGKMSFVDMPASELLGNYREAEIDEATMTGARKSLFGLGKVILALNFDLRKIPYDACKLTTILKSDLTTDCQIGFIATVSPSSTSLRETYNTLDYAEMLKFASIDGEVVVRPKSAGAGTLKQSLEDPAFEMEIIASEVCQMRDDLNKAAVRYEFFFKPFDTSRKCIIRSVSNLYEEIDVLEHDVTVARDNYNMFAENLAALQSVMPDEDYKAQAIDIEEKQGSVPEMLEIINEWRGRVNQLISALNGFDDLFKSTSQYGTTFQGEETLQDEAAGITQPKVPQFVKDLWDDPPSYEPKRGDSEEGLKHVSERLKYLKVRENSPEQSALVQEVHEVQIHASQGAVRKVKKVEKKKERDPAKPSKKSKRDKEEKKPCDAAEAAEQAQGPEEKKERRDGSERSKKTKRDKEEEIKPCASAAAAETMQAKDPKETKERSKKSKRDKEAKKPCESAEAAETTQAKDPEKVDYKKLYPSFAKLFSKKKERRDPAERPKKSKSDKEEKKPCESAEAAEAIQAKVEPAEKSSMASSGTATEEEPSLDYFVRKMISDLKNTKRYSSDCTTQWATMEKEQQITLKIIEDMIIFLAELLRQIQQGLK